MAVATQDLGDFARFGLKPYDFFGQIAELPFINALYLYGSRARGDYSWNSDIDLAVAMKDDQPEHMHRLLDIIDEARTLLEIDCVKLGDIPKALEKEIAKDGKLLFGKPYEFHPASDQSE